MERNTPLIGLLLAAICIFIFPVTLNADSHDGGKAACEAGDASACYQGAVDSFIVQRHGLAFDLFNLACDGNIGNGCHFVGRFLDTGTGVAQNTPKALTFFEKACENGAANSCFWAADMYRDGSEVEKDLPKATALYQVGCEAHFRDRDCTQASAAYAEGIENFTDDQKESMAGMNKRSERMCRSIYFPC